jgi:hypothetical protein
MRNFTFKNTRPLQQDLRRWYLLLIVGAAGVLEIRQFAAFFFTWFIPYCCVVRTLTLSEMDMPVFEDRLPLVFI